MLRLAGPNSCGISRAAAALSLILSFAALAGETSFPPDIRPLLDTYCLKCHTAPKAKGGADISAIKDIPGVYKNLKLAGTIVKQLREREMPPEGKPQPKPEERERLIAWFDKTIESIDSDAIVKDPGRVLIHRLSRAEYNNTIRDLLGVDTHPADKFPADGSGGGGFDNNADTLFVPPILMEKYLAAADEILNQADGKRLYADLSGSESPKRGSARKYIEAFASRAFRRPVEKDEIERFARVVERSEKSGKSFDEAMKTAYKAVLVSPNFLFRIEADQPAPGPYLLNDYELASRLSYFIWSSMPDEELFKQAKKKKLHDPKILDEQVRRMIADPKSRALAENFATQWLGVRNLKTSAQPDLRRFPNYTPTLRDAMYNEAVECFNALLRDDASVLNLVDCNYTFVNEELAKHYGITGVAGPDVRRVALNDPNRGGVLGMGAVLTLTSYPLRTSPVLRGKWVLEELLGTPSPPPPANVGLLPPDDTSKDGKTFRQRLEIHRTKAECAACHKRMDPLGFGLENFDAIGRWRTEAAGQPVDATGMLVSGEKFTGPAELKKLLLLQKEQFLENLTERMLAYALGRGLDYYDIPAVRKITRDMAKNGYRSTILVQGVINSFPFQYRRNAPAEETKK